MSRRLAVYIRERFDGDQEDCVTDPAAQPELDNTGSSRLHLLYSPLIPNSSIYLHKLVRIPDRINNLGWISKKDIPET